MAYTLSTMLTELYSRGFSYLNDGGAGATRATRWLNDSTHDIDSLEAWPYLSLNSGAGISVAPLTIATASVEIEEVTFDSIPLEASTREELLSLYGTLTTAGIPVYYYMSTQSSSGTIVNVFPTNTAAKLYVGYTTVGTDMSSGSDVPLMPDRYRAAIVERACAYAYRDNDDWQMASICMAESERIVQTMRESYLRAPGVLTQTVYGYSQDW